MQEITANDNSASWKAELHLIRWPNLLIIIFIQVLVFFAFAKPEWLESAFDGYLFLIRLIVMTLCAAASGYYINELLDREADRLNGRHNVLNAGEITPKRVRRNYIIGIVCGALPCLSLAGLSFHYLWIYAGTIFLLWIYSKYLKRLPLIGNLVISFFCAGVVVIPWYPVYPLSEVPWKLWVLIIFAFVITLIREIVKDMEDVYGDTQVGDRTFPIMFGTISTKVVVSILMISTLAGLMLPEIRPTFQNPIAFIFWIATIGILVGSAVYFLIKAVEKSHYHDVSTLMKVAMLTGTLFIVL